MGSAGAYLFLVVGRLYSEERHAIRTALDGA